MNVSPFTISPLRIPHTFWYKCLVCQRFFQYPEKLISHRNSTSCGRLYPNPCSPIKSEDNVDDAARQEKNRTLEDAVSPQAQASSNSPNIEAKIIEQLSTSEEDESDIIVHSNSGDSCDSMPKLDYFGDLTETEGDVGPYNCYFCGLEVKESAELEDHMKMHTGEEDFRSIACKPSSSRPKLQKTGSGEMQIKNTICTRGTTMVFDEISGVQVFPCQFCEKSYKHLWSLNRHLRDNHDFKPYVCEICKMRFVRARFPQKHMSLYHT